MKSDCDCCVWASDIECSTCKKDEFYDKLLKRHEEAYGHKFR